MKLTNFKNVIAFVAATLLGLSAATSPAWADGNVSVQMTGQNQLTVTGDSKNNSIEIYQTGKKLVVVAHDGTMLNNTPLIRDLTFPLVSRVGSARELVVDMGKGDDLLEIHDTIDVTKIEASTGPGKGDLGDFRNLKVQGDVGLGSQHGLLEVRAVDARWLICYAPECEVTSTDSQYLWVMSNTVGLNNPQADEALVQTLPNAIRSEIVIDSLDANIVEVITEGTNSKDNIELTRCEVFDDLTIRTGDQYDYLVLDRNECQDIEIDLGSSPSYDVALISGDEFRDLSIINDDSRPYISIDDVVGEYIDIDVEGDGGWTYLTQVELTGEANVILGSGNDYLSTFGLVAQHVFFDGGPGRDVLNRRGWLGSNDIVNFEVFLY